jgi:hypothetical protein
MVPDSYGELGPTIALHEAAVAGCTGEDSNRRNAISESVSEFTLPIEAVRAPSTKLRIWGSRRRENFKGSPQQQKLGQLSKMALRLAQATLTCAAAAKHTTNPQRRREPWSHPDLIRPLAKQRHREAFAVTGSDRLFLMS